MIRQLPNLITVARLVLVPPVGWLLWHQDYGIALVVIAVAGLSDFIDGELARRFDWRSRFGQFADPLADKLLVAVMFVVLVVQQHIPIWLALVVVLRDVVILGGAGAYRVVFRDIEISPTFVSKANTAVQVVLPILVLVTLLDISTLSGLVAAMVDPWLFGVAAAFAVWSGLDYVISWSRRAIDGMQERGAP